MKKHTTSKNVKLAPQDNQKLQPEDKLKLQQLILLNTEALTQEKFKDWSLDRENEKIRLMSGNEITITQVKKFIADSIQPYVALFTRDTEFYQEICRLKGWPPETVKVYHKPQVVAWITNAFIYSRFSVQAVPILQGVNPYVNRHLRRYKFHQFLTLSARDKVVEFIKEMVVIMKTCSEWPEFKKKYFDTVKMPGQLDVFQ